MKRLSGRQTRRVNQLEGRTGTIWEGRFKLSPIDTDEYLMQCCRYVELNPVKAALVTKPELYLWSSYRSKIGLEDSRILDEDECYLGLNNPKLDYQQFVESGVSEQESEFIRNQVSRNQLTGGVRFVEEVERRQGIRIETRGRGRPPESS